MEYCFFLGGYDLEMLEIKKLLLAQGYTEGVNLFDKKLAWGAKLSDYADVFQKDMINVCIELTEDMPISQKYLRIDHHNELSNLPASLEQIAQLLGITLNREQELIAENDKHYIPGMKAIGAKDAEIADIRQRDRAAQGVSDEDEKLAEESITKNKTAIGLRKFVVYSLTPRFSTITDRLFGQYDGLLIYNDSELTYYGSDKTALENQFVDLLIEGKMYAGNGFLGVGKNSLDKEVFETILNTIKKQMSILFSHHIFLFPFKWQIHTQKAGASMSEKHNLSAIDDWAKANPIWEVFDFKFGKTSSGQYNTYNEYIYFHDYVRDILSLDGDGSVTKRQYAYKVKPNMAEYAINIKDNNAITTFELAIEDISLNFYETGVGVMSFLLNNFSAPSFDGVLKINEYGRRIFPQFLGCQEGKPLTDETKNNFLADSIVLKGLTEEAIEERFEHYDSWENIEKQPFKLPKHIQSLFGKQFKTKGETLDYQDIIVEPVIDDRMFTICFYQNTEKIKILRRYDKIKEIYNWQTSFDWFRFIFLDDSTASCQSKSLMKRLLSESTNDRWIENKDNKAQLTGHLFGISRYSFMVLTADSWFSQNLLIHHVKNIYFQMILLALVQRASILKFSGEATQITNNLNDEKNTAFHITQLYENYIKFINKIYFREVTPQEQGIELYNLLQKQMDIERHVKDLDVEIQELHNYAVLIENKRLAEEQEIQNKELANLSRLAGLFLPATLVLTFLGMNYFGGDGGLHFGSGVLDWQKANFISVVAIFFLILLTMVFSKKVVRFLFKIFRL